MEMVEEEQIQPKVSTRDIRFQEFVEKGEEVDRISSLPDSLLIEILSRLPSTKNAIKTGTLSKRWEHVWTLVPTLIFEHNDDKHSHSEFASLVDKTLTQCRQLKLKKFEVMFTGYFFGFKPQVNNWIRYALRCNVEELNLKLPRLAANFFVDQVFFINTYLTDLTLSGCHFNPVGEISWKNLRRLCYYDGKLDEDLIENILSGSPVLETLVLECCYGYKRLNITSKSLKNLVLFGNDDLFAEYEITEINAPNILSLTIEGDLKLWKPVLVDVSSLVEANLDYTKFGFYEEEEEEKLKEFILNLHHVKELKIGVKCSEDVSRLEAKGFILPSNIKFIDITCDSN